MTKLLGSILILIAIPLNGCAANASGAATSRSCEPQREFYVVSHGWHTGLVVPVADVESRLPGLAATVGTAYLAEFGWGDAEYYRAPEPSAALALRAVLYPTESVVHVVALPSNRPQAYFANSTVFTLSVPESGYVRLLDHIVETFARAADGTVTPLESGIYGKSSFYHAHGSFHALNTCNTWVARGVAATGYPLANATLITADELLRELSQGGDQPCYRAQRLAGAQVE